MAKNTGFKVSPHETNRMHVQRTFRPAAARPDLRKFNKKQDSASKLLNQSYHLPKTPKQCNFNNSRKSDIYVSQHDDVPKCNLSKVASAPTSVKKSKDYYKRYEHDELPVKDNASYVICGDNSSNSTDNVLLTESHIKRLEKSVFANTSRELETNESSMQTHPSMGFDIEFFKTTVHDIFDKFETSMRDFKTYKKKFIEILNKNHDESLTEMKNFITDTIQHIKSSDSSCYNDISHLEMKNKGTYVTSRTESSAAWSNSAANIELLQSLHSIIEAYKNHNYLSDSTVENQDQPNIKSEEFDKNGMLNIFLWSNIPYSGYNINDRNLLSEINIRGTSSKHTESVASADNLKVLAAKRLQLENVVEDAQDAPEKDIPVRLSFPKKDIHLNQDFTREKDGDKSLISKICSYLCKKFRKNAFS